MDSSGALGVVWIVGIVVLVFYVFSGKRRRRLRGRIGPGASGAVYDLLSEDRRKAVEIIVEQRAEERRPEYPDGNLPDLDAPKKPDPK